MSDEIMAERKYKNNVIYKESLENAMSSINDTMNKLFIAKERSLIKMTEYEELKAIAVELNQMLYKVKKDI